MATNEEVLYPKALIIPLISNPDSQPAGTATGNIFMSGAKLYFCDGTSRKLVTSA